MLEVERSKRKVNTNDISVVSRRKKTKDVNEAKVLISGLSGVGAQAAKCLVLAGVKSLTLHDDVIVDRSELASNPFVTDEQVGENRALVCAHHLHALNTEVHIDVWTSKIESPQQISEFQVVVFTNSTLSESILFDDYCHNHSPPISFIMVDVRGLCGRVFCDFGHVYSCSVKQERAICRHEKRSIITINEDHPDVVGAYTTRGNDAVQHFIERTTTPPGECNQCALAAAETPEAQFESLSFRSLREASELQNPNELIFDSNICGKEQRPLLLHIAFRALDEFVKQHECLPAPNSWKDHHRFFLLAKSMMKQVSPFDITKELPLLQQFSKGCTALIGPMASIFGGIVGNEVVKVLSGVSYPIRQFFYFDSLESLPSNDVDLTPQLSRYYAQTLVFGRVVQEKLEQARLLVVGDGALGCEMMTNLALMGVGSGTDGKVISTHRLPTYKRMHNERQTIFEDEYERLCTPLIATSSAISINNNLNIGCLKEVESVYEDTFWKNLDVLIDATNDVHSIRSSHHISRHFCMPYLYPLVAKAKCHSMANLSSPKRSGLNEVIFRYPFVWRLYEKYLGWARSEFEGFFVKLPRIVNLFLSHHDSFVTTVRLSDNPQSRELLQCIIESLESHYCTTIEDCISWALTRYNDYFNEGVRLFLSSLEVQKSVKGKKWTAIQQTGVMQTPKPEEFTVNNSNHKDFVVEACILRATTYGIDIPDSLDWVEVIERVQSLSQKKVMCSYVDGLIDDLVLRAEDIVERLPSGYRMKVVLFNVDDENHMRLVTCMFNLTLMSESHFKLCEDRAKEVLRRCYPLPSPTSYTVAAGLVCLNLYKLIGDGIDQVKDLKNTHISLDFPHHTFSSSVNKVLDVWN